MTRLLVSFVVLSLTTFTLAAQRDGFRSGADAPVTIRGCLHDDLLLRANQPEYQALDSRNWVSQGQRFALSGDRDLMEELEDHVRHEVEVIGRFDVPDRRPPIAVTPPRGLPGRLPNGRPDPFSRAPTRAPPVTYYPGPDELAHLVVTAYEHVSLNCRQ